MMNLMKFSLIFSLLLLEAHGHFDEVNVASLENGATCDTSSVLDGTYRCNNAIDAMETPTESEWATEMNGIGHFITINHRMPALVGEMKILQRCSSVDMVKEVRVGFSDSSSQTLTLSCDGGGQDSTDCAGITWETFTLSPVTTSFINITITDVCSQAGFNGFREIVVLGMEQEIFNMALASNGGSCIASSERNGNYLCNNAIDQVISPAIEGCWLTTGDDYVGAWIRINLPRQARVTTIRTLNRCQLKDQMASVRIDFDGGLSMDTGLSCLDGAVDDDCPEQTWDVLPVQNIITSSVMITGLTACSESPTRMAFQEVEVYGTPYISESGCPLNFTPSANPVSCYQFVHQVQDMRNHSEAKAACTALYYSARLVEIGTLEEQQFLVAEAEQNRMNGVPCSDYYMGGIRALDDARDWYWESDLELIPVSERYWGPGEPADEGMYMSFRYHSGSSPGEEWQWAAVSNTQALCYICESDPIV